MSTLRKIKRIAIELRELADELDSLEMPVVAPVAKTVESAPRVVSAAILQIPLPAKRFLSDSEIETTFGINRRTLQNWRVLGRGPIYKKFGATVRYDIGDVESWIKTVSVGGAGVPACAVQDGAK